MNLKYAIKTFGCQMNYSDSERVAQVMEDCGFEKTDDFKTANFMVVNTCSVRQTAENKANGFLVSQKKKNPKVIMGVTGCMVRQTGNRENSKDKLLKHKPIDLVFRIEDCAKLPKLLESYFPEHSFADFVQKFGSGSLENYFQIVPKVENPIQVFVPIIQGCDKFCTYCIIPYTRGREISRSMNEIFEECEKLVEQGAIEITLLGQNVNSYVQEGVRCFPQLLKKIDSLHEKGLSRLRFTSAHPQDFTEEVVDVLAEMKTSCPYIHLPVQYGADALLRSMNRNYSIDEYEMIIKKIRSTIPNCTISTDIIVGFPGESQEDFEALCDFAKRMDFDFSYTAIFSPRKNTPAEKMSDQFIDSDTKKERFHIFDEIIKKIAFEKREKYIGKTLEVLIEKVEKMENGLFRNSGRSREFFEVSIDSQVSFVGQEVAVEITKTQNYILIGTLKKVHS